MNPDKEKLLKILVDSLHQTVHVVEVRSSSYQGYGSSPILDYKVCYSIKSAERAKEQFLKSILYSSITPFGLPRYKITINEQELS